MLVSVRVCHSGSLTHCFLICSIPFPQPGSGYQLVSSVVHWPEVPSFLDKTPLHHRSVDRLCEAPPGQHFRPKTQRTSHECHHSPLTMAQALALAESGGNTAWPGSCPYLPLIPLLHLRSSSKSTIQLTPPREQTHKNWEGASLDGFEFQWEILKRAKDIMEAFQTASSLQVGMVRGRHLSWLPY